MKEVVKFIIAIAAHTVKVLKFYLTPNFVFVIQSKNGRILILWVQINDLKFSMRKYLHA